MEVRINFKKSFTLVEVLVSIALITIIGTASYFGIVTVSRANREAENQAMAVNLAQKSIEEIRAYARDNFDMLSTIETDPQFTNVPSEFSRLGFQPIAIKVNKVDGSTELNNIDLTISWNDEKGNLRNYNYTFMVGRPADPLPGNIKGKVLNADTNEPVELAEVTATYDVEGSTLSVTRQTNANGEYTFEDASGSFIMKPGDWSLEAKHSNFYDYPSAGNKHIETVSSGQETVASDILMIPLPTPAKIKAQLVNKNNGIKLNISADADLWKDGKHYQDGYFDSSGKLHNNSGKHYFEIPFEDTNEKCFTLTTGDTDYTDYPLLKGYSGDFCGPTNDGYGPVDADLTSKNYNYRGWSSSVVRESGNAVCANPFFGSQATDRICVGPGDEISIHVPLVPIPKATVEGYVRDANGNPLSGAVVYINWHISTSSSYRWITVYTDHNGHYSVDVPAEQELFPESSSYYLWMYAGKSMPQQECCDTSGSQWMSDGWYRVGPLFQGSVKERNFTLGFPAPEKCGNVDGYVKDGKTGSPLKSASVRVYNNSKWQDSTDASGYYKIECSNNKGCRVPVGDYWMRAWKGDYYYFYSWGRHPYKHLGKVSIQEGETTRFTEIQLWPMGYGTIKGKVVDANTNAPIKGASVEFDCYYSSSCDENDTTDSNGEFEFNNALESWPPPGLPNNGYFSTDKKTHSIKVTKSGYYPATMSNISLDAGQTKDIGTISLTAKSGGGGM